MCRCVVTIQLIAVVLSILSAIGTPKTLGTKLFYTYTIRYNLAILGFNVVINFA